MSADHFLLLVSSSVLAASLASMVLASVMIILVLAAYRVGIDPDNVASPIAGMLGDTCTLGLVALIAELFWETRNDWQMLQVGVLAVYCLLVPLFARIALECRHTSAILRQGWTPIIVSMLISSAGGLILKHAVHTFRGLSRFAPVMNGAGGNLAAVQASRLSTDLHGSGLPGSPPSQTFLDEDSEPASGARSRGGSILRKISSLCPSLLGKAPHARTARVLIFMSVPASCCFVLLISVISFGGVTSPGFFFLLAYATATLVQVCLLMFAAQNLVLMLWSRGVDPDNAAIPYVTALGDVIGSTVLTFVFWVLTRYGDNPFESLPLTRATTLPPLYF